MTEPSDALPPLPAFVRRRDGRLVPFDADRICRTLFVAAARLGQSDPFLARELTDGVLHFLAADAGATVPTTEQIREHTAKVVRELGHPALAVVVAEDHPEAVVPTDVVFSPDLVAAHHDGLLVLGGRDAPFELESCVLKPPDSLASLRQVCGGTVVLDGPEYTLAREDTSATAFIRQLLDGLRATRLRAVVNLNSAAPPPWADDLADGPLFASRRGPEPDHLARLADELLGLIPSDAPVRIDWHLSARDFEPAAGPRLSRVVGRALAGDPVAFVFDRPRRPVPLAEGVDRQHPAALLTVGLSLPRLAEQVLPTFTAPRPRLDGEAVQRLLSKLGSLARMALSAGLQKRDYLRRYAHDRPALTRGFLLDRARLVVTPVGLETVTRTLLGRGLCGGGAGLEFARRVVVRLREVLRTEGRAARLETCLDGTGEGVGLTAWDASASPEAQLHAGGHLHAGGDTGIATVLLTPNASVDSEAVLRKVCEREEVVRLVFNGTRPEGWRPAESE